MGRRICLETCLKLNKKELLCMTSQCLCKQKLWKQACVPKFLQATICNLLTYLFSLWLTRLYNLQLSIQHPHHLRNLPPLETHHLFPPRLSPSPPGQICGCVWQALHEETPQPVHPLWAGCCVMRCDWRWEPNTAATAPVCLQLRRGWEGVKSVRQSGSSKKTPSWVHSSSPLPLLCS